MQICVLGGGNGAYGGAADLSHLGHTVALWRRDAQGLAPLLASRALTLKNSSGEHLVPLADVTTDIAQALRGAALIVVPVPAFAQDDIARAMAPHLQDGQVIFLPPGSFGSVTMKRTLRAAGCRADVAFAETGTLPWLARKHGPTSINVTVRATRLPTGIYPARLSAHAFEVLRMAFPSVEPAEDALAGALLNAGPVIHPPLILMNAGPLEHFERWDIHNEGTQPSIRRVTNALDEERIAVRRALGYSHEHFPLRDHYENDRWMYGDAHRQLVKSGDWREHIPLLQHRYMLEDVHMGLAFLVSVGAWAGVETPVAAGLLAIAGAICGQDLRQGPRTLGGLGLAGLSPAAMKALLAEGEAA